MKKLFNLLLFLFLCAGNVLADTEPGNNSPGTTSDMLSIGLPQNGSLGGSDQYDYYQLTTATDGNIVISASNNNNAYLFIYLYDSDGSTQLAANGGFAQSGISLTASGLAAGTYYALVYSSAVTNYTLNGTLISSLYANDQEPNNVPLQAITLTMPNPVTGHIAYRANGGGIDNYDYYAVTSNADGDILVNFSNDNNAYSYLYLYDIDGTTQLNSSAGYAGSGISMTTAGLAAGTYYVVVYGTGYCGYTMTTSLNANPMPNDPISNSHFINAPSFAQNDSINGHIAYRNNGGSYDNYDYYSFYSSGDYDITISLKNNTNAYTYIYLFDTDTITQLGSAAGYAQGGISFTTNGLAAGTYYIMVYASAGAHSGYTLKNTYTPNPLAGDPEPNNLPGQATPFPVNSSLTGHIAYRNIGGSHDVNDYYQLVTTQDGNIQISLTNTNNSYTYIYLYDQDGSTQLGSAAAYAQSGVSFTVNGLAAGTYYVLVYASGGSYSGYTLSNTLTVTPYENDIEDNGTSGTAQALNNSPVKSGHIGHRYNGGSYDNYDYRKITMLNLDSLRIELSFSYTNYVYVYLYNAAQSQLYGNAGYGGNYVIFFNALPAGDYYLVVYASSPNAYTINKFFYPCDPSPSIITAGGPVTFCQGGNVALNASNAFNGYLWSNGETTGSIVTGLSGNYSLTASDFDGCPHVSNTITVSALPNTLYFADGDGDGYGNNALTQNSCTGNPPGYVSDNSDCNDGNAAINPGASELCNALDDNCNGSTDEGLTYTTYYIDADNDTYGDASSTQSTCSGAPAGYVSNSTDCNDTDNSIHPGAPELCNGLDDNCNGSTDEGCSTYTYFADTDGDGFGNSGTSTSSPSPVPPAGYVSNSTDCDDGNPLIHPGATESCNNLDDNCNGLTDEGLTTLTYFADADGDNYGTAAISQSTCNGMPPGYVANNGDCNDANASIHPGAAEVCNGIDDNCNGLADDGLTFLTYYADGDGDGYGNAVIQQSTCSGAPSGYVSNSGDCVDGNASIHPGAAEVCNGIDDNCNGLADDGLTFLTYYADGDGDGYGNAVIQQSTCSGAPSGYVSNSGDCQDGNAAIYPGSVEICNGFDDNCNGIVDEGCGGCGTPGSINGPAQLCTPTGQIVTYSVLPVPGAFAYNWTVPAGTIITGGQGTESITVRWPFSVIHGGLQGDICVTYTAACGTSLPSCLPISVQLSAPVRPASITGNNKACDGDSYVYTITPVPRASTYNWSVPTGATITNGQGTTSITVLFGGSFSGGEITVHSSNSCGNSPDRALTISRNILKASTAINGLAKGVCGSNGIAYTCASVPGAASYQWSVPAGATLVSGQGTSSIQVNFSNSFTGGTLSVSALNNCGTGASRSMSVTGSPAQPGPVTGPVTTCTNQLNTYEVAAVTGASLYTWNVPSHTSILNGQGTRTLDVKMSNQPVSNFTLSVKATNSCGSSPLRKLENISTTTCIRASDETVFRSMNVYPNPATERLFVTFNVTAEQTTQIRLLDITGRLMLHQSNRSYEGENSFTIDLHQLHPGSYLLHLSGGGTVETVPITVY
ncbi:MAG: pre-peptidase C-terminal domain-containing protein [Bacteroidia bacterium]|nr:pre-peptidase C-terminal domain-containing protein [Bacteroidia bacterium]